MTKHIGMLSYTSVGITTWLGHGAHLGIHTGTQSQGGTKGARLSPSANFLDMPHNFHCPNAETGQHYYVKVTQLKFPVRIILLSGYPPPTHHLLLFMQTKREFREAGDISESGSSSQKALCPIFTTWKREVSWQPPFPSREVGQAHRQRTDLCPQEPSCPIPVLLTDASKIVWSVLQSISKFQ